MGLKATSENWTVGQSAIDGAFQRKTNIVFSHWLLDSWATNVPMSWGSSQRIDVVSDTTHWKSKIFDTTKCALWHGQNLTPSEVENHQYHHYNIQNCKTPNKTYNNYFTLGNFLTGNGKENMGTCHRLRKSRIGFPGAMFHCQRKKWAYQVQCAQLILKLCHSQEFTRCPEVVQVVSDMLMRGEKTETMASKSHGFTNFPRFHWWFPSLSQRFFRLRHGFSPSGGSRRSPARRRRGGPPRAAAPRQQCWSPKPGPQGKSSRGQLTRDLLGK